MANKLILKKSSVATKVPLATDLEVGEIAVNLTDQKLYSKKSDGTVILVGTGLSGTGTVTSVGATVPSFLSVSGSPITTSGTLAIGYSGTALPVANGGTGATTSAGALTSLGAYPATNPNGYTSNLGTVTAVSGTAPIVSSGGTTPAISISPATTSVAGSMSATDKTKLDGIATGATANTGTVTSVGGTGTVNGISLSGTVTTSGSLTLGGTLSGVNLATQVTGTLPVANGGTGNTTAQAEMNRVAGAVTSAQYLRGNGTNVVMSAIQASDVPTLNQSTTGNAATATVLQTTRAINGTNFNGSAAITTANWGTARTLWGQSVNGSANITAPLLPDAGSVSAPAFSTSGDTNTGIFFPTADTMAFTEGGVERMRIDSAGRVGIGTSTPASPLSVKGTIEGIPNDFNDSDIVLGSQRTANGNAYIDLVGDTTYTDFGLRIIRGNAGANTQSTIAHRGTGDLGLQAVEATSITFATNNIERARINSSGQLLVGATTADSSANTLFVAGLIGSRGTAGRQGTTGVSNGNVNNFWWSGSALQVWIDDSNVGNITIASDYRIKQDIQTQTQTALDRVLNLRPVSYKLKDYGNLFKADGVQREGFIAHELAEIIPSAVDGKKDDPNQIQSLKLDALCSVMVKAIQELSAKVDTLQAEINTLKGN